MQKRNIEQKCNYFSARKFKNSILMDEGPYPREFNY